MKDIPTLILETKRKRNPPSPTHVNRASELGHPCDRYLFLQRTRWEEAAPPDDGLLLAFEEGHVHEEAVKQDLRDAGIKITEEQRNFVHKENGKTLLTGRIDGILHADGEEYPFDVKGYSPYTWEKIEKLDDFFFSKYAHLQKIPAQMLLYLFLSEKPVGLLLLKNKASGRLRQIEVRLDEHLDYVEGLLRRAKDIDTAVSLDEIPPPRWDEPVCTACPFYRRACFPVEDRGPGISLVQDAEFEARLSRWHELRPLAKEYEDLDGQIGRELQVLNVKDLLVGGFRIIRRLVEGNRKPSAGGPYSYWKKEIIKLGEPPGVTNADEGSIPKASEQGAPRRRGVIALKSKELADSIDFQ